MILSVNKDTYEQLGLEGKESQYTHKQPMRYGEFLMGTLDTSLYKRIVVFCIADLFLFLWISLFVVVTVDLADKSMVPGSKRYNRVLWALKEKVPLKMDFLLARHSAGK